MCGFVGFSNLKKIYLIQKIFRKNEFISYKSWAR